MFVISKFVSKFFLNLNLLLPLSLEFLYMHSFFQKKAESLKVIKSCLNGYRYNLSFEILFIGLQTTQ